MADSCWTPMPTSLSSSLEPCHMGQLRRICARISLKCFATWDRTIGQLLLMGCKESRSSESKPPDLFCCPVLVVSRQDFCTEAPSEQQHRHATVQSKLRHVWSYFVTFCCLAQLSWKKEEQTCVRHSLLVHICGFELLKSILSAHASTKLF